MVMTPSSSASPRLSLLRRNTNPPQPKKNDFNTFLKHYKPLPQQPTTKPVLPEPTRESSSLKPSLKETSILEGVVAYLDVR